MRRSQGAISMFCLGIFLLRHLTVDAGYLAGTSAGAVGWNAYVGLLHVAWASSQYGSRVPRPISQERPGGSCITFHDLASEAT